METFIIYAIGITITILSLYAFGVLLAPYSPDAIKNSHFECGLPASGSTPKKANFGFFMFAIMFIIADMTGLFFSLFVYAHDSRSQTIAAVFALIIALALIIAMKEYNHAQNI